MTKLDFFPVGLATGEAFCDRVNEREVLRQSILNLEHIVMVSARRYGKTSLITQVIQENNLLAVSIDFLPATDENYVKNAVLVGVSNIVSQFLNRKAGLKNKLLQLFAKFNPKIVLTAFGQSIELSTPLSSPRTIIDALITLDQAAKQAKQKVVFVMDEFQQVGELSKSHSIEASVRHAVERSKNVVYIFSGSNRRLLEQMFNDKKRPLYHLCDLMKLDRISYEDYAPFIQAAFKRKWHKRIPDAIIDEILSLTECHTYYVNRLCRALWKQKNLPTAENVKQHWDQYINEKFPWITKDVACFSPNQRKVLAALSHVPTKELQGKEFCKLTSLTPASIRRVIDTMMQKDYLYIGDDGNYKLLDPALSHYFKSINYFGFE